MPIAQKPENDIMKHAQSVAVPAPIQTPNVFKFDVAKTLDSDVRNNADEDELVKELLKYTTATMNPFKASWDVTIRDCYNFKELKQWESDDVSMLLNSDTPALPVDRINRSLDTIKGIRENTGNKKKIVAGETGDNYTADLLDKACDYFSEHGDFDDAQDDAFDSLLDIGIGMLKICWDGKAYNGFGDLYAESCNVESMGWSFTRSKKFKDVTWVYQHYVMSYDNAIKLAPSKAAQLKTMAMMSSQDWEKIKGGGLSSILSRDYAQSVSVSEGVYSYPGQVDIFEFYVKRIVPFKRVMKIVEQPNPALMQAQQQTGEQDLNALSQQLQIPPTIPTQDWRNESDIYQPQEGESVLDSYNEEWWKFLLATRAPASASGSTVTTTTPTSGLFLSGELFGDENPYAPYIAEFKKSGEPRGFIEPLIPHQKRANIAWSQKISFNNKSLKAPYIFRDGDIKDNNIEHITTSSEIGSVIVLSKNASEPILPQAPQVNLQAIEEGNIARQDMDFAAAASEPVLRGQAGSTKSGLQLSMQQSAAITPVNKWTKAESSALKLFWHKALKLILKNVMPDRLRMIVGEQYFDSLTQPQQDQLSGRVLPPKIQLPLNMQLADYAVKIQDMSVSDFNKQQSFNAIEELVETGVPFTDDYRIRNAPIRDTDAALNANSQARMDLVKMLMSKVQFLENEVKELGGSDNSDQGGGGNPRHQPNRRNQRQGRNAKQSGKRSMLGGQNGT